MWKGDPGSKGAVVKIDEGKTKPGSMEGRLPGLDCIVQPEEPAQVTVVSQPSGPKWEQMVFQVASGGKGTTVHLRLFCAGK